MTGAAALFIIMLVPLAALVSDGRIGAMDLLSDPTELTGAPWYLGTVSSVNLLIWAAGAALFLVVGTAKRSRSPRLGVALWLLGGITLLFTLDDQFLLHEIFIPWIFGFPETVTFALYAVALAIIVLRFRKELLEQSEASILVVALLALGASVATDLLGWDATGRRVVEEGLKLLGALAWAAFPAKLVIRFVSVAPP